MKKMSTRLLSLLLVLCMMLTLVPAVSAAPAAEANVEAEVVEPDYFTSDDWIWSSNTIRGNSVSYFRNDYTLKETPVSMTVRTSAHNHLKFYVNGNLITGYVSPAPTAVPENINYLTYTFTGSELTALLNQNTTELALAAAVQYMGKGGMNYVAGKPGFWAEVTVNYANGSDVLLTDSTWMALEDNPYKAETPSMSNRQMNAQIDYDARKMPDPLAWTKYGYDETGWTAAVAADVLTNSYKLREQTIPEGEIHDEITPVAVGRQRAGWQVFDVGRIATGWVKISASAPAGTRICIRYSEDLTGSAGDQYVRHNVANEGSETYCDYYTFSGNGVETFAADFDYKAFRYFEVVGLTEMITVEDVTMQWASTGVEYTADFTSSDDMLNMIYQACINTQINNLEGMPVDCPHREQSQYLADSQLQYALLSYAFSDFAGINYKTMLDFAAQQFDSGRFTFVAPSQMYASGNSIPEWDLRYSNMLYNYYWVSGDLEGMSCFYDDAVENVNYYLGYLDGTGLLPDIDGWNISDHPEKQACSDDPGAAPTVVNILLYDSLNHLSKIATLLGKDSDAAAWATKATTLRAAINTNLLNHETGMYYKYYGSSQTNEGITAMAINLGVSESLLLDQQMEAISAKGLSSTSVVLTYEVFNTIMAHGTAAQKEAIYERIIRTWGQMIKAGESTCWEGFRDENSHTHAWNAYPAYTMLKCFLGVNYNGINYTDITVAPWLPEELTNASGHVTVPGERGTVGVEITRAENGDMGLKVENNTADTITIAVPRVSGGNTVITEATLGKVFENGKGLSDTLTCIGNDAEYVYFTGAANTTYTFTSTATAAATEGTFDVTINGTEGGKVKVNGTVVTLPYTASMEAGAKVTVEAIADKNAAFIGWSGTYGSVEDAFTFNVGGNVNLTANFEAREGTVYSTITIEGPKNGGLKVEVNGASYALPARIAVEAGAKITIRAIETEKRTWNFVAWTGDIFSPKTELNLVADDNMNLEVIGSYRGEEAGNLALHKSASFNHQLESAPLWLMSNLTDGSTFGKNPGAVGATSGSYPSGDLSANPNVLTLDLDKVCEFNQIYLYPRADEVSADGGVPCYPSTFTISVSEDGSVYKDVLAVKDHVSERNTDGTVDPIVLNFDAQEARYIRMTTTKANGADNWGTCYVQLHEMEVYNTGASADGHPTLTINGTGSVLINGQRQALPYTGSYARGTELAIQADPTATTRFTGWSGEVTSSNAVLYVTMENSMKVRASYTNTTVGKSENLALNAPVTVPADLVDGVGSEQWNTTYLTDGIQTSTGATAVDGKKGFTSINYASATLEDESLYVDIDLGADVDFNQITLWPRTDVFGANGEPESPNFPTEFKVQYRLDGDTEWRDIATFDKVANPAGSSATFELGMQNGRYIRIIPITLGSPAADDVVHAKPYRFQLAEIEVFGNELLTDNLATSATITSNNTGSNAGAWSLENLVDGQVRSAGRGSDKGTKGFTSNSYGKTQKDISADPHEIVFTFGSAIDMNQVVLYPRSDLDGDTLNSGLAANFPEDFHIDAKVNGTWETVYTATGVNNGLSPVVCNFNTVNATALKIVTTRLGVCACDETSRALRVQLAEIKIGNVLRGDVNVGAIDVTANGEDEVTITSYEDLVQLMAAVEKSEVGGSNLVWSIETEEGFVADFAELTATNGTEPVLSAFADGDAYVVARFDNGLATCDKLPIHVEQYTGPVIGDVTIGVTAEENVTVDTEELTFTVSAKDMVNTANVTVNVELSSLLADPEVTALNDWYIIGQVIRDNTMTVVLAHNLPGVTSEEYSDILSIKAKTTGKVGDATVTVTKAVISAYDGEGENFVNAIVDNASATTKVEYSVYDVNHDGVVNQLDITRAQRWYGTADETCDVNNDGEVNITDLILILNNYTVKYTNF